MDHARVLSATGFLPWPGRTRHASSAREACVCLAFRVGYRVSAGRRGRKNGRGVVRIAWDPLRLIVERRCAMVARYMEGCGATSILGGVLQRPPKAPVSGIPFPTPLLRLPPSAIHRISYRNIHDVFILRHMTPEHTSRLPCLPFQQS